MMKYESIKTGFKKNWAFVEVPTILAQEVGKNPKSALIYRL